MRMRERGRGRKIEVEGEQEGEGKTGEGDIRRDTKPSGTGRNGQAHFPPKLLLHSTLVLVHGTLPQRDHVSA